MMDCFPRKVTWYVKNHAKMSVSLKLTFFFFSQWSYGVTCWEVFSGGKVPYPGVDPRALSQLLDNGERLSKPNNAACPDHM